MHYFDANATAPLHPAAREAWLRAEDELWQNPASPSAAGARAHAALEDARARLARRLGLRDAASVLFTGGATEANNAVLAFEAERSPDGLAIVSAVEHPSVLEPAAKFFGRRLRILPVDTNGAVRLDVLAAWLAAGGVTLVSVMAVNNETGVVQPVAQVRELAARHGARVHCDATQWFGKLSQAVSPLPPCDYTAGCAHKFGGPKGVGFLAFDAKDNPRFCGQCGGGQENDHRAGTVNVPAIVAMLTALEAADAEATAPAIAAREAVRAAFEENISRRLSGVRIHGGAVARVWNTVSLALPRHANMRWLKRLEKRGFVVSTGSACASASGKPSPVLAAMGCGDDVAQRTLRLSALWATAPEEWAALAEAFGAVAEELGTEK
jgi:cysteine desulfurase